MRRHLVLVVSSLLGAALAACAPSAPETAPRPTPSEALQAALLAPEQQLDTLVASLGLRERVAQLVMPWIPGSYAAFDDEAFLRMQGWVDSLHVGGLIVSLGSPLDVAVKLNRLQRRSRLPLLVAADLEGGTAIRLTGGTAFPTNMGVAAAGSEADAYEMGRITALEGRAVGIHLTFAPVADVNNNPANPIINTRSFGEDPRAVARLVAATVRGVQAHGMLATAKHFPGHGDTGTDSHISLPVIAADWRRLDSLELVPFRAAIAAGVAVVMSAHIALPGVDSGRVRPGTVAPNILTGILRDSLGFEGITVTDALNMGGLVRSYGPGEAAVRAFLAGADLLLQPSDPAVAIDAMVAAVERGEIPAERLERSLRRVLALKQRLGLFERRTVELDSIPSIVGRAEHQARARDVAARSIVMVRDVGGTVHGLRRAGPVALVAYGDANGSTVGNELAAELRAQGIPVSLFRLFPPSGPASYDSARALLADRPVALFAVSIRATAWRGTIGLPEPLAALIDSTARTRPTILASFGNPYLIAQVPSVGSYLLGWTANPLTERAMARALAGAAPITGRLPISIPPNYPIGWGVMRRVRMEPAPAPAPASAAASADGARPAAVDAP